MAATREAQAAADYFNVLTRENDIPLAAAVAMTTQWITAQYLPKGLEVTHRHVEPEVKKEDWEG